MRCVALHMLKYVFEHEKAILRLVEVLIKLFFFTLIMLEEHFYFCRIFIYFHND